MKLKRPSAPPHNETIIALIDVVFFLLVFFMLIGRMDATAPFDVLPPQAQSGRDMPAGGVTLSVGALGDLALDGRPVGRASVGESLAGQIAADPGVRLRINAHKQAELRHVLPLVGLAEAAGFSDVVLVVTPGASP